MHAVARFNRPIASLCGPLGQADRHVGLSKYCTVLMLSLSCRSGEAIGSLLGLAARECTAPGAALLHVQIRVAGPCGV